MTKDLIMQTEKSTRAITGLEILNILWDWTYFPKARRSSKRLRRPSYQGETTDAAYADPLGFVSKDPEWANVLMGILDGEFESSTLGNWSGEL